MSYAVTNIYEWMGFEIADCLLASGKEVVGAGTAETDQQKYLEMFFGRNANFQQVDQLVSAAHHDVIFDVGDMQKGSIYYEPSTRKFVIGKESENRPEMQVVIHIPMLVGRWMPMNEEGVFVNEQHIPFFDEKFRRSIAIDSLVLSLLQLPAISKLPEAITILPKSSPTHANEERQTIYMIDDYNAQGKKTRLLEHFHDHPEFFQLCH
ncbi:hypothetical protein ACFSMW_02080 [Virgibacillus halophilus]|uniref:Uncharacterized protein n=1 Tax=Tigheibacillus halophilus TaxID=361280 RepID=A0ABU5C9R4_9BACI|nr:hypothetical protein [Virgibacillus halophilus]